MLEVAAKKKFIFTDIDLDGAMSYLLFLWFNNNKQIPYITTKVNDFKSSFEAWSAKRGVDKYDSVYILDIDTSQDSQRLVDKDNIVVIDHHDTHVANKDKYKHCKHFITEKTSCSRHIYDLLAKSVDVQLTDKQKHLMLLVDDYDCYKLQLPHTHALNIIFWNYQGDKLARFVARFKNGFDGFTEEEQSIISFYNKKIDRVISELKYFQGRVTISKTEYNFISTFASECINDVAHHITENKGADVSIVINLNNNRISFRKSKGVDLDLSKIASKIADGGGHKYAAGGILTPKFKEFSKLFKPLP
jgi:nanoRNase/pAp phosphatase (c-di-AMP/oligoRNAs hydrolase)